LLSPGSYQDLEISTFHDIFFPAILKFTALQQAVTRLKIDDPRLLIATPVTMTVVRLPKIRKFNTYIAAPEGVLQMQRDAMDAV